MPRPKRPTDQTLRSTHKQRKLNGAFKSARMVFHEDGSITAEEVESRTPGNDSIEFCYDSSRFNAGQIHLAFKEFVTQVMGAFPFRPVRVRKTKPPAKIIEHANNP